MPDLGLRQIGLSRHKQYTAFWHYLIAALLCSCFVLVSLSNILLRSFIMCARMCVIVSMYM